MPVEQIMKHTRKVVLSEVHLHPAYHYNTALFSTVSKHVYKVRGGVLLLVKHKYAFDLDSSFIGGKSDRLVFMSKYICIPI